MHIEGVVWDLDGTLADTLPLCITVFRRVFDAFTGRVYADEEIIAMFGATEGGMIRTLVPDRWREGEAAYLAEYARLHTVMASVLPGVEEALRCVRGWGLRQAVVTGKGERSTAISLEQLGLAPFFDVVETGSPDGPSKPAGMRRVLARWGTMPGATAYVGDTPYDAQAATEVGLVALGAAWASSTTVGQVEAPFAATFTSPAALVAWLDSRRREAAGERPA